jgi:hypothetical protein
VWHPPTRCQPNVLGQGHATENVAMSEHDSLYCRRRLENAAI